MSSIMTLVETNGLQWIVQCYPHPSGPHVRSTRQFSFLTIELRTWYCLSVRLAAGWVIKYVMSNRQIQWNKSTHGRFIYDIKKRVYCNMLGFGNTRKDKVIIFKIHLSKCNFKVLHRLTAHNSTGLYDCVVSETVKHYPFVCFLHVAELTNLFRAIDALQLNQLEFWNGMLSLLLVHTCICKACINLINQIHSVYLTDTALVFYIPTLGIMV